MRGRRLVPSLRSLADHRLRAALVVSSVAVGVAAVIVTSGLGGGVRDEVRRGIEGMGTNLLLVRPAEVRRLPSRPAIRGLVTTLTRDDVEAIAGLPLVAAAAPAAEKMRARAIANGVSTLTKVVGTTPAFFAVRRFRLDEGRFLDDEDDRSAARVAVLGARVREALFPGGDAVGRTIRLSGVPFEVVGVLAAKGMVAGSDEDGQVVVPVTAALRRVLNVAWLSSAYVSLKDGRALESGQGERAIRDLLRARHGKPGLDAPDDVTDVAIQNQAKMVAVQKETADTLVLATSGLSGIALLVGGTGILALMRLSLEERRPEIGLRMAVGATPRDVLLQFLIEAAALALAAWVAGAAAGALATRGLAAATGWSLRVPAGALLSSLGVTLATGLGFGALPARAASLVVPVEALASR